MRRVTSQGGASLGLTFLISLAISLWSANSGMKALFDALNIVYDERRSGDFSPQRVSHSPSAPSCNQTGACISAFGRHCPNRSCSSSTALSMCCRPKRTVTAASISPPRGRGRATAIASVAQAGRGLRARSARRCISSIRRGCDCRLGALLGRRLRGEAAYHLRLRRRAPDRRRHHARAPQQHHRRPVQRRDLRHFDLGYYDFA